MIETRTEWVEFTTLSGEENPLGSIDLVSHNFLSHAQTILSTSYGTRDKAIVKSRRTELVFVQVNQGWKLTVLAAKRRGA